MSIDFCLKNGVGTTIFSVFGLIMVFGENGRMIRPCGILIFRRRTDAE